MLPADAVAPDHHLEVALEPDGLLRGSTAAVVDLVHRACRRILERRIRAGVVGSGGGFGHQKPGGGDEKRCAGSLGHFPYRRGLIQGGGRQ